jgi:hypothetical protein
VIQGFHQRWVTDDLYKRLFWDYFRTLSVIIVQRCEAIALERRLMKLQVRTAWMWRRRACLTGGRRHGCSGSFFS